jgi:hypothetical protein
MVHPGLLLGLFAAKKAIAVTLYYSLKEYGFARAYRRFLEANRRLTPPANQKAVSKLVRTSFEAPAKAAELLRDSDVYNFATRLYKALPGGGILGKAVSVMDEVVKSQTASADFFKTLQSEADADKARKGSGKSNNDEGNGNKRGAVKEAKRSK